MKQQTSAVMTLGGLVCVSVLLAMMASRVLDLDGKLARVIEHSTLKEHMQTLSEVVTTSTGRKVTVTTQRYDGESIDAFVARHLLAVNAVLEG